MAIKLSRSMGHGFQAGHGQRSCPRTNMVCEPNNSDEVEVIPCPESRRVVLAHIRELVTKSPPNIFTTSLEDVRWKPISQTNSEAHRMPTPYNLVAMWSAQQQREPQHVTSMITTPLVHIPRCRLEVSTFPDLSWQGGAGAGKIERFALSGELVRSLISQIPLPNTAATVTRHFDDDHDWTYSRCLLADFSGLDEHEAAEMSEQGRLCCWVSVVAMREADGEKWDIGVVVHRVLTHCRSGSGSGSGPASGSGGCSCP